MKINYFDENDPDEKIKKYLLCIENVQKEKPDTENIKKKNFKYLCNHRFLLCLGFVYCFNTYVNSTGPTNTLSVSL